MPSTCVGGHSVPQLEHTAAQYGSPLKRPSIAWSLPDAVATEVTAMSLMRIATPSPTSAPATATGEQTSCPPRIAGVIIGPQQPGVEFQTMWPPSATGPSIAASGPSVPSVNVSTTTVRRASVDMAIGSPSFSAAGDRQQQGDLLAVGQGLVAGHVLSCHDRKHRAQRGRELGFGVREPREEIADGGALSHLDGQQRRGRKAREPGAEADTYRHRGASLTPRRE